MIHEKFSRNENNEEPFVDTKEIIGYHGDSIYKNEYNIETQKELHIKNEVYSAS